MENPKSQSRLKKILLIILAVVIVGALGVGGYFCRIKYGANKTKKIERTNTTIPNQPDAISPSNFQAVVIDTNESTTIVNIGDIVKITMPDDGLAMNYDTNILQIISSESAVPLKVNRAFKVIGDGITKVEKGDFSVTISTGKGSLTQSNFTTVQWANGGALYFVDTDKSTVTVNVGDNVDIATADDGNAISFDKNILLGISADTVGPSKVGYAFEVVGVGTTKFEKGSFSVTIIAKAKESERKSIDATWDLYTNYKLGFSIKIPKQVLNYADNRDNKMIPFEINEQEGNRVGIGTPGNGWSILIQNGIKNDADLLKFIQTQYMPECLLGAKKETAIQVGTYDVSIDENGASGGEGCFLNFGYGVKYSPSLQKVAQWTSGQYPHFFIDQNTLVDSEIENSFKFIK
ncbi:MAG: hypothetical protein PHU42_04495 [Patescibacteria group bacterium]|nr:hypothetical protein [Patescibacteria group bacterium]